MIGCAFKRFALSQVAILVLCEDAGLVTSDHALPSPPGSRCQPAAKKRRDSMFNVATRDFPFPASDHLGAPRMTQYRQLVTQTLPCGSTQIVISVYSLITVVRLAPRFRFFFLSGVRGSSTPPNCNRRIPETRTRRCGYVPARPIRSL